MGDDKKYDCVICHTTDIKKYTATRKDICKDCKKTHVVCSCKHCGDNNPENFDIKGKNPRYTTCKKCRNKAIVSCIVEKEREDKFSEIPYDKELTNQMRKFIWTDLFTMGKTIKNILEELTDSVKSINKREENYQEAYESLINIREEFSEIKESHAKLAIENKALRMQNNKLILQIDKITKRSSLMGKTYMKKKFKFATKNVKSKKSKDEDIEIFY